MTEGSPGDIGQMSTEWREPLTRRVESRLRIAMLLISSPLLALPGRSVCCLVFGYEVDARLVRVDLITAPSGRYSGFDCPIDLSLISRSIARCSNRLVIVRC
jgi:hypothetical protein